MMDTAHIIGVFGCFLSVFQFGTSSLMYSQILYCPDSKHKVAQIQQWEADESSTKSL